MLGRRPVLAAPFDGPAGHRKPVLIEDFVAGREIVAAESFARAGPLADFGRNLRRVEGAQLVAEGGFVRCERQLHGSLLCWIRRSLPCTLSAWPTNQSGGSVIRRLCTAGSLSTAGAGRPRDGPAGTVGAPTVGGMRTELPAERLHRRLGAESDTDADNTDADTDPNSLLPRWLPDGSAGGAGGWIAQVRAGPGRAGAVAWAAIAAIAVLVAIFTRMRDQPARVRSAKLPPVEPVSSSTRGPHPDATTKPDHPGAGSA